MDRRSRFRCWCTAPAIPRVHPRLPCRHHAPRWERQRRKSNSFFPLQRRTFPETVDLNHQRNGKRAGTRRRLPIRSNISRSSADPGLSSVGKPTGVASREKAWASAGYGSVDPRGERVTENWWPVADSSRLRRCARGAGQQQDDHRPRTVTATSPYTQRCRCDGWTRLAKWGTRSPDRYFVAYLGLRCMLHAVIDDRGTRAHLTYIGNPAVSTGWSEPTTRTNGGNT